jgi:hypothetical protein
MCSMMTLRFLTWYLMVYWRPPLSGSPMERVKKCKHIYFLYWRYYPMTSHLGPNRWTNLITTTQHPHPPPHPHISPPFMFFLGLFSSPTIIQYKIFFTPINPRLIQAKSHTCAPGKPIHPCLMHDSFMVKIILVLEVVEIKRICYWIKVLLVEDKFPKFNEKLEW